MKNHELGNEKATAVFKKDNKKGLPTELPKVIVE